MPLGSIPTVLLVGRTKIGKTSSIVKALGGDCFYLCTERGALTPALNPAVNESLRGPRPWRPVEGPDYVECLATDDPCGEVEKAIDKVAPRLGHPFGAVALDTLSTLATRDFSWLVNVKRVSTKYAEHYRTLYDRLRHILYRLMQQHVLVLATAHEQEPTMIEGKFKPGGAALPGRLVEDVPSLFDIILRCGTEAAPGGSVRPVFRCNWLDNEYRTGDRTGVVRPVEPMDLRSILRRVAFASMGRQAEVDKEIADCDARASNGAASRIQATVNQATTGQGGNPAAPPE